jgi:hypothetical protein
MLFGEPLIRSYLNLLGLPGAVPPACWFPG